jgi:carboxylate-amine ligase
MSRPRHLHLFEGFGVELEYMIVDAETLAVRPITDRLLHAVARQYVSEVDMGAISWSNELVLHVVELKTTSPAATLDGLTKQFQEHVGRINGLLEPWGARLMPTAMHPWMDPATEMRLWPHEYSPVYAALDRIFDCRGHGWANLQSVHLNLPFADDEEFGRLHAAIRLVLPILPALAASSPILEGRLTGMQDTRLDVYRTNAARIPRVTGQVVPEPVYSRADYEREILQPLYAAIAPFDAQGTLQYEWLNARGAIARFDRNSIEIRLLDVQECPAADVAICAAVVAALHGLVSERWSDVDAQQLYPSEPLVELLSEATRDADQAVIVETDYLALFGYGGPVPCTARDLWRHLIEASSGPLDGIAACFRDTLRTIVETGPLARRILDCLRPDASRERMFRVYRDLCDCLAQGRMFAGIAEARV